MNDTQDAHAGGPADGQQFAMEMLATIRQDALQKVQRLNTVPEGQRNPMFLSQDRHNSVHAMAHASVLAYWGELAKDRYLSETNTRGFFEENFLKMQAPRALYEDEQGVIDVAVDRPSDPVDPATSDIEMGPVNLSLADMDWWINRFVIIRKEITNPYLTYEDATLERHKLVLPPKALSDTFYRLDDLAAKYNVLVDVKEAGQSALSI